MSDSDDSLPYLDLENIPDDENEPMPDASLTQSNQGPKPSTSKAHLSSLEDIIGEDELLRKLVNGEITYTEYNVQMGRDDEDLDMDDLEDRNLTVDDEFSGSGTIIKKEMAKEKKLSTTTYEERKLKRAKKHLPLALQGLMGQANLCFARGETELAERLCLQIIKEVPLAPEPFLTLAQIYETTDLEKYTQFSLIAAHLNPGDVEQWVRIGESLVEQGNVKQAITCFTKAIKANPRNLNTRIRRIELLESIDEEKYAFRCYAALIPYVPIEQGEFLIQIAKKVAQKYHSEGNVTGALNAMESAYKKVPKLFKFEDINLLLELLLETGAYKRALDVLCIHTDVHIQYHYAGDEFILESISDLDELILDFHTKMIVTLIHLKCFTWLDVLVKNVFEKINIEEAGDCYLDIAEALLQEEKYEYALTLLDPLVKSTNYSLAAVWLRHADCHRAIGNISEAITSYRCVVNLSQHLGARLTLAALLKQKGLFNDALIALQQDSETELIDPGVLYERCLLLKEINRHEEFIKDGYTLILRHCIIIRNKSEMQAMCTMKYSNRMSALRDLRTGRCEPVDDFDIPEFSKSDIEPTLEQEWNLFLDVLRSCYEIKKFNAFQLMTFTALSSKKMIPYQKEIEFLSFLSCLYAKDYSLGYTIFRDWVIKDVKNKRLWNILNQLIHIADDIRHNRFVSRLFAKHEVPPLVHLMQGNNYLTAGTYKYALNDYVTLFKDIKDPILPLLIGVTLVNIASQKYSARKHSIITQAVAYMEEYRKLREPEAEQEVHYNFGRMYHQLGLNTLALDNYHKALEVDNEMIREHSEYLSIRAETAFNIHLIYKASGNHELARKYLNDYIVV